MLGIDISRKYLGLHEEKDNDKLRFLLKSGGDDIAINPAKTPWCAAWINYCERAAGNKGTGMLNARSFLTYGKPVKDLKDAKEGDILVFKRGIASWQGHVTYYAGYDKSLGIKVLGGNQKDSVCEAYYSPGTLLGIRRPPGA